MQVTETSSSGLKRELKVVVGQSELSERFTSRIDEVQGQIQLKGFRKGKVPIAHIKKLYGRSVMAEVVQQAVEETSRKAVQDRNERPAHQPNIDFTEDKEEIERVLAGQGDLAYTMSFEILPNILVTDLSQLKLEREVADVADEAVEKAVADLVERSIKYEAEAERAAGKGDRLTIGFVGRIDGVEFEGGKGEDVQLVVGEGQFIPGFVEGLEGAKAAEERIVKVKFPDDYPGKEVAGKDAEFTVGVKEVAKPVRPEVDDEFAKTLGAQSLDNLKELVRGRIAGEYASVARAKLKRQALDALDKAHDFVLPETLVSGEFDGIWRRFVQSLEGEGKTIADAGKPEDELKAEYRKIAERRVRLGLVIGEIGDKQKLQVSQDELKRALIEQARRYPGQERFVYEYYEKNPAALVELRAPIFEDKVIDHILELAKPAEKKVTAEALLKPMAGDEDALAHVHHHGHDHHHHDHDHSHDHGHHHDHHHHDHDHPHDHGHDHQHGGDKR
ncbi:MAG: trigger factor [Hyphomonadaceae bacterium]|jgi:trigger factor|nr:trigger factor [Hyphomonadaceae bacterium]